ncbi:MAG: hypothetical protein ACOX7Q_16315 [Kiritimatiellia bacterium]|jgi:hypothetical protein
MKSNVLFASCVISLSFISVFAILSVLSFSRVRAQEKAACASEKRAWQQTDWAAVTNLYRIYASKLVSTNVPGYEEYRQPFRGGGAPSGYEIRSDYEGETVTAEGQLNLSFNRHTLTPCRIYNKKLIDFVNTNAVQKVPTLTMTEAVREAKRYLELIGIPLSSNVILTSCIFNDPYYKHSWTITWEPTAGGHAYDTVMEPYVQFVSVIFNERYGFLRFHMQDYWPLPKSTDVKLTREEALTKAERAAPLVFKTPMFRARNGHSDYKVRTVEEIALRVYLPNWALDPKRAVWIRDRPPTETRLCWMVHFVTVDVHTGKTGEHGNNPQYVWIYVDAVTGEIVGANFT